MTPKSALFPSTFRGYNKKQVLRHLKEQKEDAEQAMEAKQERLIELRNENLGLKKELERLRGQERDIADALVEAQVQARIILMEAREKGLAEQRKKAEELARLDALIAARREKLKDMAGRVQNMALMFKEEVSLIEDVVSSGHAPGKEEVAPKGEDKDLTKIRNVFG